MTDITPAEPRAPGRPKGSTNRKRAATVERINSEADPIGFLCKIVRGGKIKAAAEHGAASRSWIYPTLDQRKDAAATLAKKVMPDLRPSEVGISINGEGGTTIQIVTGIARLPTDDPIDMTPAVLADDTPGPA